MFYEETNKIPLLAEYDVIVVGGGVGGCAAALAAAREGMKTLILEKTVALGGQATLGHVTCYQPLDDGYGNQVIGGISEEFLKLSIKYGYDNLPGEWRKRLGIEDGRGQDEEMWSHYNADLRCQTMFNMPAFVLALDEIMEREGVDVLFDTVVCKPVMDGNTCTALIVENKSGRGAYSAKMIVDASGDADVFFRGGAQCSVEENYITYIGYHTDFAHMQDAIDHQNMYRALPDWLFLGFRPLGGTGKIKTYLGTTADGVNSFIKDARKLAFDYLKEHFGPDYTLLSIPGIPAFRRTRRINGFHTLTPDDYFCHFEDSIGITGDWRRIGPVIEIPYSSMIDPKLTNVLAAGRITASAGDAWELTRCIPPAAVTGEAAGIAAAMAIRGGYTVRQMPVAELQKKIQEKGGFIHMDDHVIASEKGKV